ncbi:unnamed protein product, partial [Larinioides sclopetarius]
AQLLAHALLYALSKRTRNEHSKISVFSVLNVFSMPVFPFLRTHPFIAVRNARARCTAETCACAKSKQPSDAKKQWRRVVLMCSVCFAY